MNGSVVKRMPRVIIAVTFLIALSFLTSHASGSTPSFTWTLMQSGTTQQLNDIDGAVYGNGGYDLWAVGNAGTILHFSNNTWKQYTPVTPENLNSVYYQGSTYVWAVGNNGTILFYDYPYDRWIPQSSNAPAGCDLQGVSGCGGASGSYFESIWAVGATSSAPVILRFNLPPSTEARAGSWVQETCPSAVALNDVVAVEWHDAWAVGTGGGIIHTAPQHNETWVEARPPDTSENLFAICGEAYYGGYNLWAGGDAHTPLYYCSGGYLITEANSFGTIFGMEHDSYDIAAWAVGDMGLIYSYKNVDTPWESVYQPGVTLRGVCHLTDRTIWLVGDNGTIYRGVGYLGNNFVELTLSTTSTYPGGDFHLYYNCHASEWNYYGVPIDIYLAYIVNPTVSDKAATVAETLNSGIVNIFGPGMSYYYRYSGQLRPPTFGNVRIPPANASGSLHFAISSSSPPGTIAFAAVFRRRDNGQFVRTDYQAELSPALTVD